MGNSLIQGYCGPSRIISSLGNDTGANVDSIERYETRLERLGCGTPVCLMNRETLDVTGLDGYTFAEQLCLLALKEVSAQSGVPLNGEKTLLILSTTKGNIAGIATDFQKSYLWEMAERIVSYFGCSEKPVIVSNACISGVAAVVMGARWIEQGKYDHVYVVGVDVASEFVVSGFNSFKSVSPILCKPYDVARDGLTLGEGCGALLLTKDRALSDSGIVIAGGAISEDANHISGPSRTGEGLFYALDGAMKRAGIMPGAVGLVNAHGTGTPFNDEMESKALKQAMLDQTACNSLKPYLGHTLGASGVIEVILTVEQMRRNRVFGVKGYERSGVPFELNVSARHRDIALHHAVKCASGFGGTNAAVVLSKEELESVEACGEKFEEQVRGEWGVQGGALERIRVEETAQLEIEEVALVEMGVQPGVPFAEYIRTEYKALGEPNLKFFKMDNLCKLGYVASCKLMRGVELSYPANRIGVVLANRSGSLDTDLVHQRIVEEHLPEGASPAVFVYTLANVVAAEMAIKHKWQGELSVFVCREKEMNFVAGYSRQLIQTGVCDAVVYGWCELLGEDYLAELKLIRKK